MQDNNEKNNISYPNCCIMADGVRVLCVDNEPGLPELVRIFLEESGEFTVDTVRSAPAALAVLRGRTYDAIVSGFAMPDMDGIEFLKSVRASDTTVPFIFFTGRGSEEVAIDAINNGADFYLRKGSEPKARFAELKQGILQAVRQRKTRIKKEQDLRESEEKYRSLVETSPNIIWETDRQGIFRYVSPQSWAIMGYTPEEIIGRSVIDLVPEKLRPLMIQELGRLSSGGSLSPFEVPARHRDGHALVLEIRPSLAGTNGKREGFRGMAVDITERRRDEDALREANKKLNLLSGITRHDIMNKLMALDGYVALLHNKIPDPSGNQYFSRITAASSQIANLIQFTGEYEKVGLHAPVWVDIHTLVDDAGRNTVPGEVALINDLPAGTEIFADPLVAKVFFNLIDNALRHGGTITTIRFFCEERDGKRVIVCADDGDGVRADEKERIFERGFGKNTGFGLAVCREILDITGMTIKESGEPGRGARFEIAVPKGQYRSLP
jgi:PAS domain S-box-containing protein